MDGEALLIRIGKPFLVATLEELDCDWFQFTLVLKARI